MIVGQLTGRSLLGNARGKRRAYQRAPRIRPSTARRLASLTPISTGSVPKIGVLI